MAETTPPGTQRAPDRASRSERLMLVAAVLLGVFAIVMAFGLASLVRAHDVVLQGIAQNRGLRVATYNLVQASVDAETAQRGYLLTDDRRFLEPYDRGRVTTAESLERLRAAVGDDPNFAPIIARVDHLSQSAFGALQATLDLRRHGGASTRAFRASLDQSKQAMDSLRSELGVLLQAMERRFDATRANERQASNALYWLGGVLAFFCLVAVSLTLLALRAERKNWRTAFEALAQAKRAAEVAREHAAESDLAKTRFLAVASHDMRQPLHALTLYLSALERRVEGEEARGIITKMERATESMVAMFSTLLDLARIQAGVVTPEISEFPLQDVFDRIIAENPGSRVEAAPTSIALKSDPVLVERVLRNLVSNAVKHGGGKARISAVIAGDRAEIAVIDNGPGISSEDQERIFDEFVRLDSHSEGLGLGLAIVKRISDMLDMPLRVVSEPGHGARFVLQAQLAGAGAQRTPRTAAPAAHLEGAPVLVIDDDPLAREAVSGVLRDLGALVRSGANEAEGEAIFAEGFTPRLLLMDLRIDGALVGVDIARRFRARFDQPPRVIVITGDTGPETLTLLRNSGFAWLIKPVSTQALSETAAEQLAAA